jgi:hypothetical protein
MPSGTSKEVGQEVSLLQEILDLVRSQIQASTLGESTQKAVEPISRSCQEKTSTLNDIFQEIGKRKKNDKEAKDWTALVNSYRTMLLRMGKVHRVEVLMQDIPNGL